MSSSVIAIAQNCKSSHDWALAVWAATTTDSLNERSQFFIRYRRWVYQLQSQQHFSLPLKILQETEGLLYTSSEVIRLANITHSAFNNQYDKGQYPWEISSAQKWQTLWAVDDVFSETTVLAMERLGLPFAMLGAERTEYKCSAGFALCYLCLLARIFAVTSFPLSPSRRPFFYAFTLSFRIRPLVQLFSMCLVVIVVVVREWSTDTWTVSWPRNGERGEKESECWKWVRLTLKVIALRNILINYSPALLHSAHESRKLPPISSYI